MALKAADRVLTIVVTATLTSAAWIVAGGGFIERAREQSGLDRLSLPQADRAPEAEPDAASAAGEGDAADPLHPGTVSIPGGPASGELLIPVAGIAPGELTDTFNNSRGGGARLHEAIDIVAPTGTPVLAAAPGTVERLFQSDAGGKTIYVRSGDRMTIHYYAHLQDYAPGLQEGQSVRRGERLGTVGFSGNASPDAPHLHFALLRTTPDAEWWEPATAINPYPLLASGGR